MNDQDKATIQVYLYKEMRKLEALEYESSFVGRIKDIDAIKAALAALDEPQPPAMVALPDEIAQTIEMQLKERQQQVEMAMREYKDSVYPKIQGDWAIRLKGIKAALAWLELQQPPAMVAMLNDLTQLSDKGLTTYVCALRGGHSGLEGGAYYEDIEASNMGDAARIFYDKHTRWPTDVCVKGSNLDYTRKLEAERAVLTARVAELEAEKITLWHTIDTQAEYIDKLEKPNE